VSRQAPVAPDRRLLFSDAVFAISATLLVLDIRIAPGLGSAQLSQALRDQLPAIAAYAFSFGVIGQLWLFHHRTFGFIARSTPPSWCGASSCWP
jgi:TMEM175 potassium channel family protein